MIKTQSCLSAEISLDGNRFYFIKDNIWSEKVKYGSEGVGPIIVTVQLVLDRITGLTGNFFSSK
jgi:hypothetical protein